MPMLPPKQLTMVTSQKSVRNLPDVTLPDGYMLRGYLPGDEVSWSKTLQVCGFKDWDYAEVVDYLKNAERRAGSRVVEHEGEIVAATFASRKKRSATDTVNGADTHNEGLLDFVVTHPDHRGNGLGKATCTEVARFLVNRGCESVSLLTDDWRLPAIHIYLSLGFEPVMNRSDMPRRWQVIFNKLKENGRDHTKT